MLILFYNPMSVSSLLVEKKSETDAEGRSIPSNDVVARTIDYAAAKGINEIKVDGYSAMVDEIIEEMKTYAIENYGVILGGVNIARAWVKGDSENAEIFN